MRVLIVTASTGQGHVSAARALQQAFARAGPQVSCAVLDACSNRLIRSAAATYNLVLRCRPLWMRPYFAAVHLLRVDRVGAWLTSRWAREIFRSQRPTFVVSVHPMLNFGITSTALRLGVTMPYAVVLTDPYPPFWRGWADPQATVTVVASQAARDQLIRWGVPEGRITIGGMPIGSAYRRAAAAGDRAEIRERLGLQPDRFTLLVHAGSAGRPSTLRVMRELGSATALHASIQVVFAAGRHPALAAQIARLELPFPVKLLDWQEDLSVLLDAVDATFTKPGGLSVYEAIAKGVPVLVDACEGVMPQERGLAAWLETARIGWKVRRPAEVVRILGQTGSAEWQAMQARARASVSGDAGTIASDLLELAVSATETRPPALPTRHP